MPTSAQSEGGSVACAVLALFLQLHGQIRAEIEVLDREALNWVPTEGANSVATIVTHLLGSEAETVCSVAELPCERDRDAEFVDRERTIDVMLAMLDQADDLIRVAKPNINDARLKAVFALPTLPANEKRSGLTWLVGNYGHAREHVGQIEVTKQLYQQGAAGS